MVTLEEATTLNLHGICEYCGELKPVEQLGRCSTPEVEEPLHCYACGRITEFSSSQARKGNHARCQACVDAGRKQRFQTFLEQAGGHPNRLLKAVEEINEHLVRTLLEEEIEVDPTRQQLMKIEGLRAWRAAYTADGQAVPEEDPENHQPTTPLKMAVFRLSDCMLDEAARLSLVNIAQTLIEHGAPRAAAKELFENRYGPAEADEEENAYTQLYALLSASWDHLLCLPLCLEIVLQITAPAGTSCP